MAIIEISEQNLNEIMTELGFPILELDEDFPYTTEQIKSLAIWPAMKEYYRWFPKTIIKEYPVTGNFSIDFPSEDTYYIVDASLNANGIASGGITSDPFANAMNIQQSSSRTSGMYGTRYDYSISTAFHSKRAEINAMGNSQNAFRIDVHEEERKVSGYSNIGGRLTIVWACIGYNYNNISFRRIDEVKKLASANLLRMLGGLIEMQASDTINELDGANLIDRAEDLEKEVLEKWQNTTKPVVIR